MYGWACSKANRQKLTFHPAISPRFMFFCWIRLLLGAITSACACPLKGCEYFQEDKLLTCMNVITTINRVRQEVLALQVCEYGEEKLNFTWLFDHFPNVVNITINGGNISSVIWKEDDENALQVLLFICLISRCNFYFGRYWNYITLQ